MGAFTEKPPLREYHLMRALNSAKRLVRLLELSAPDIVVANEICLLTKYSKTASKEIAEQMGAFEHMRLKRDAGYCSEPSCSTPLTSDSVYCHDHQITLEAELGDDEIVDGSRQVIRLIDPEKPQ
jgi:hypothetical protein